MPNTPVLVVVGRMGPDDVPALRDRLGALIEASDDEVVICDVGGLTDPDIGTVDAICRLALATRRLRRLLRLRNPSSRLVDLLNLAGIGGLVGFPDGSGLESER